MSPLTHIVKKTPGSDLGRAGGRYFREQCDVIHINFAVAAQARA
jgi:hypothetical protein